jgi:hypothetical protein
MADSLISTNWRARAAEFRTILNLLTDPDARAMATDIAKYYDSLAALQEAREREQRQKGEGMW